VVVVVVMVASVMWCGDGEGDEVVVVVVMVASVMWCGDGEGDEVVWPAVDGDEWEGGNGCGCGFGGGGDAWWRVVWWI
nr:hypothetical protein [Tanacetum cinerariifolium]